MNLPDPTDAVEMTGAHYLAQSKFVTSYLSDYSEINAAKAAGYTGKYPGKKGKAMLAWPGTRSLIKEQLASLSNTGKVTREWILSELLARYEDSVYAETPRYLESAKILEMIKKSAGLEEVKDDNELIVQIKQFTQPKPSKPPKPIEPKGTKEGELNAS